MEIPEKIETHERQENLKNKHETWDYNIKIMERGYLIGS